jgi:hypothetical protein
LWLVLLRGYRKTSEKDVVNTVAGTDLLNGDITIGAGVMGTDKTLRATLIGDYLNNTGAVRSLTVSVSFGGVTLWTETIGDGVNTIGASGNRRAMRISLEIANLGAANSQMMTGMIALSGLGAATGTGADLAGLTRLYTNAGNSERSTFGSSGAIAVDTASAQALLVTVTHSTASASLSARLKYAIIEIV